MYEYKLSLKIEKSGMDHPFFGMGPVVLLQRIDDTSSIAKAAKSMNMAYTKALRIIRRAEAAIGQPLIKATTGGAGGGGSVLTENARTLVRAYQSFYREIDQKTAECFKKTMLPAIQSTHPH